MLPLVVVVGPTAVGKSDLAVELALRLHSEIISADSMQVYKYLQIGTAKLTREEQKGIAHHFLSFLEPYENFSVAQFQCLARGKIAEIAEKGKLPLLVGGTGLYVQAVIDPYEFPEINKVEEVRQKLLNRIKKGEGDKLHTELFRVDPLTAARLHPNDYRRITRALEVYYLTGKPISDYHRKSQQKPLYKTVMIGLTRNREELYERIENRVEKMYQKGLVEELKDLLEKGYSFNLKPFQALGYKQTLAYLQGEYDLPTAIYLTKKATKNYAKRQLTWFKRDSRIQWFYLQGEKINKNILEEIIASICRIFPEFREY